MSGQKFDSQTSSNTSDALDHAPNLSKTATAQDHVGPFGDDRPLALVPTITHSLGHPTALAIGAFATTLTSLSFALMGWRGLSVTNVFIGDFFFVAGIGMLISAQWEIVRGNSFAYTVLSAFGLFYAGYGAIITPAFGVQQAYGDDMVGYNNALGFFVLMWTVFNTFFLIASIPISFVYIGIFFTVELAFGFVSAAYFAAADGAADTSVKLQRVAGAFAFVSGLFGWYTLGHLMCQEALFFSFPMGDTSRFFKRNKSKQR